MIKEYGIKDWNSFIQTINGLTWSLARELGPSNIRVNYFSRWDSPGG